MKKEPTHKTVRFTSRDGWRLTATVLLTGGKWRLASIGKQHHEGRPLDFAPFHVMDAVLGAHKQSFDTMDEAVAYAKSL